LHAGRACNGELRNVVADTEPFETRVDALRQRHRADLGANAVDQRLILGQRRGGDLQVEQVLQMALQGRALIRRQLAGKVRFPIRRNELLQRLAVVVLGRMKHPVCLQRLVKKLLVLAGRVHQLLDPQRDARQQRVDQDAPIDDIGRRRQLLSLIESEALRPRHIVRRPR